MYYLHLVHARDAHDHWFVNILFFYNPPNRQAIVLFLVLDDERFLNYLFSVGFLP
jgi:hypothetical protein